MHPAFDALTVESQQLIERRNFLKLIGMTGLGSALPFDLEAEGVFSQNAPNHRSAGGVPGRIPNEYSLYLSGEKEALEAVPAVSNVVGGSVDIKLGSKTATLRLGESFD